MNLQERELCTGLGEGKNGNFFNKGFHIARLRKYLCSQFDFLVVARRARRVEGVVIEERQRDDVGKLRCI